MRDDLLHRFLRRRTPRRFRALVDGTRTRLLTAAWRVLGDVSEAEDVVQEVYMKVLDDEREPGSIRNGVAWLISTTVLRARTRLRALARRRAHEAGAAAAVSVEASTVAANPEIRDAVATVPDDLRVCTELRYFGDLSTNDIAGALDLSPRAVDKRLKKAREELAPRLAPAALGAFDLAGTACAVVPAIIETAAAGLEANAIWLASKGAATGSTVGAGAIASVVIVLGVLAGGLGMFLFAGDADEDDPPPRTHASRVSDTDDGQDGGPRLAGQGAPPTEASDDDAAPSVPEAMGTAGLLTIRILDPDGEEVKKGRMRLRPAARDGGASLGDLVDADPKLLRFAWLLDWFHLDEHNPIRLAAIPETLHGIPFVAHFDVPGLWGTPVLEVGPDAARHQEIRLKANTHLVVEVRDALDDRLLTGAMVRSKTFGPGGVEEVSWASSSKEPPQGRTGEDGRVRLEDLDGAHTHVQVVALGHREVHTPIQPVEGVMTVRLVPLAATGAIEVTVFDEHAAPLPGADVILGYDLELVRRTDGDGRVRFDGLTPGAYLVHLGAEALTRFGPDEPFAPPPATGPDVVRSMPLYVKGGQTERVQLGRLPDGGGRIRVHVVDSDANPLPELRVNLSGPSWRMGRTDAKGGVLFENLPPGSWFVTAWRERPEAIPPTSEAVQVQLRSLAEHETESLRLVFGTTRLVVEFDLEEGEVSVPGVTAKAANGQLAHPMIERDGRAVFESLWPGEWNIETHGMDSAATRTHVRIGRDAPPEPITLKIEKGGTVVLRYEEDDVRRLVDTSVRLEREGDRSRGLLPDPTGAVRWTARHVATGSWTLIVERPGKPTVTKEIVVENDATLEIVL